MGTDRWRRCSCGRGVTLWAGAGRNTLAAAATPPASQQLRLLAPTELSQAFKYRLAGDRSAGGWNAESLYLICFWILGNARNGGLTINLLTLSNTDHCFIYANKRRLQHIHTTFISTESYLIVRECKPNVPNTSLRPLFLFLWLYFTMTSFLLSQFVFLAWLWYIQPL